MSSLIKIGIKDKNGNYVNYMVSIQSEVDKYGNNVSMYLEQTKEEREAKAKRTYVGNGRVIWTDGQIKVAPNPNAPENSGADIGNSPTQASVPEPAKMPEPADYENKEEVDDDLPF
jgi:hypothetical protein